MGQRLMRPRVSAVALVVMAAVVLIAARSGTPEAGILAVLVTIVVILWLRSQGVEALGLRAPESWRRIVLTALLVGIGAQVISVLLTNPIIEHFTGKPIDLSAFEALRGDVQALITLLALVWVMVVFVEEMVFRGFFMTEIYRLLGPGPGSRIACLVLPAILFGCAHWYQGISGMLSTGLMGLLLGYLFVWAGFNLWLPILTHGFLNSAGLLLVYIGADRYPEAM
jgi:membrane protease YdiL (CAAX protease family)